MSTTKTNKSMFQKVADALPTAEKVDQFKGTSFGTAAYLSVIAGVDNNNVQRYVNRLREQKLAHIHGYTEFGKPFAIWVAGPGEDAPRPPPTKERQEERRRAKAQYAVAYQRERRREMAEAIGIPMVNTARDLTMATIERAKKEPRSWFNPMIEAPEKKA